jgi:hypothetical protein
MSVRGALGFILFMVSLLMASASSADAGVWRYCLAPSQTDHKIYISAPFSVSAEPDDSESRFEDALARLHFRHDDVQCPHSNDETSAVADKQHAIEFNRRSGNQIIDLHWTPGD